MGPEELCGLLAEPERLSAFAAVVLGARTVTEVADTTGMPVRDVEAALRRLSAGGLVSPEKGQLAADTAAFKQAVREARAAAPAAGPAEPLDPDPARAAVLRSFIRDGRLVQLPAAHGKRRVVLEHIVASFEPGVTYREREVDAVLRAWYPDHATLRRYLVDEQLMARERGSYWRIGGPVWVATDTGEETA
jgi:hypothetical protein